MAHKVKKIIPSNLFDIRTGLELSQKEFARHLGVSVRMVQFYESGATTLPIDKALIISETWGYSLDEIYSQKKETSIPNNMFLVDIRDFLSRQDNSIVFSLPDRYWCYWKERDKIENTPLARSEKKRLLATLEKKYTDSPNDILWKCVIPIQDFLSLITINNTEIPYASNEDIDTDHQPTELEIKEASDFLSKMFDNKISLNLHSHKK